MIERVCPIHGVPFIGDKCPKEDCSARPVVTTTVYWCDTHKIPLYTSVCPLCKCKASYLSTDIRPVFAAHHVLGLVALAHAKGFLNSRNGRA